MKFGHFNDENREYVIETPKTPYPWINYLGSSGFFSLISNTAGGYSFYKDALYRRLTRYRYNNVPIDTGGRYIYINEGGTIWNPGWQPVQTDLDTYQCAQGMGYTKITGSKNGLKAGQLFFVPLNFPCEIQRLRLSNKTKAPKEIKLFSYMEFCLWNAFDDMTNFQRNFSTGEVEIDGGTIYHKTEYRERRNYYSFYSVNELPDGYDTDRESFLGPYGGYHNPRTVLKGRSNDSFADGWSPVASHFFELTLPPGGDKELIFILGYVENPAENKWESPGVINKTKARKILNAFSSGTKVDAAFEELKADWSKRLSVFKIESDLPKLNRMANIWNQYQCIVTFNMSRSASYFESGISRGIGFRDTNQDLLGCLHLIPELARQRILDVAATQLEDGSAYHQYQPLTKRGNDAVGSNFNDDPLWLIFSVSAYIKETADWAVLDEKVDFDNNPALADTLLEHLRRAFNFGIKNKGPHGLPLIGRADWNDCLNLNCFSTNPNESFQTCTNKDGKTAESVMIAAMMVFIGREWVEICRRKGFDDEARQARADLDTLSGALEEHGWDGEWYLRAYDDAGQKVGSKDNREGKIFIETQGFGSMAQIGKQKGYPLKALEAVRKHLSTKHGIVLHNPPFTSYYLNLGEISTYPPGYKENAGIFCHNNPWVIIGETINGRPNQAWQYYTAIAPAWREEISEIHRMEPYIYSQMIAGKNARRFGEAKNSWLTGTAAWNFVALTQWILGVRPAYDGLYLKPCLPEQITNLIIHRQFRNQKYNIEIVKIKSDAQKIVSASLDGSPVVPDQNGGVLICPVKGKKECSVKLKIG